VSRPRIAALGGGTGLSALLRGMKRAPVDITAVVTVADDGGSSGRLRRELGVLPPGDIRNCLVALADDESLMGRLFQHRFADGDLSGHPFGNLFLAALSEVTGSFDHAVRECSRVLKIRGEVLPSTLAQIRLWAERVDGEVVSGETRIAGGTGPCRRVWLDPKPPAHPPAVEAVRRADLVLLGPGSLFTSVLPHLAIPELAQAVAETDALRVYVCNVMTQPGETDDYTVGDHLDAIQAHIGHQLFDYVIVNDGEIPEQVHQMYAEKGSKAVSVDMEEMTRRGYKVIADTLVLFRTYLRHDASKLSLHIYQLVTDWMQRKG